MSSIVCNTECGKCATVGVVAVVVDVEEISNERTESARLDSSSKLAISCDISAVVGVALVVVVTGTGVVCGADVVCKIIRDSQPLRRERRSFVLSLMSVSNAKK